jgi:hypothetical protein
MIRKMKIFKMTIGIIIGLAVIALITTMLYRRRSAIGQDKYLSTDLKAAATEPDSAVSFGYKCLWFAVKTDDKERLASIFKLKNIHGCNWRIGIDVAYKGAVFITPTIDKWTLICGWGLVDIGSSPEKAKPILQVLSKEFGDAQFFCTYRVTEYHCWMKARNGVVERVYDYSGESAENNAIEGEPTAFEQTRKLVNTLSDEAKDPKYFKNKEIIWPDEDLVMEIAGHWSIDPTKLEKRVDIKPGLGLLGSR